MNERARILVVDDHPVNIAILEELLGDDFTVESVMSGEAAIEAARCTTPDLVLLDVMLPEMDGYETCRRLRAQPELCGTRVVMLSAKAMHEDREKGFAAGADEYYTKPFDLDELYRCVESILAR